MRTYNIIIRMPKDQELFVAAYAATISYEKKLRLLKIPFQTFLVTEQNWLTDLLIPMTTHIVEDMNDVFGIHFDLSVDMKDEDIIAIGKSGKHAAYACGVMLGLTEVETLVPLQSKETKFDLTFLPWGIKATNFICNLSIKFDGILINGLEPFQSKIVVGQRSIATYIASCMGKSVLELYSLEDYPREFLSKWDNPQYSMLCCEKKEDFDNNFHIIYRSIEKKINAIIPKSRN